MNQNYRKIYLLFVALAFLLYGNTIKNGYALDDEFVVGPMSESIGGIKNIPKILKSYHAKDESGNKYEYRPMVKISYAIEVELFGNKVHIHHFFNVIYYVLCLIVLFKMLLILFENYSLQTIVWVVILFALIPVHSEVVASLKNRDVMLSFIFSMLLLIVILKWIKNQKWYYLLYGFLFFFLALLSKFDALPMMAIVPLIYFQKIKEKESNSPVKKSHILMNILFIIFGLLLMYFLLKRGQKLILDQNIKQRIFNYFENPLYFQKDIIHRIIGLFNSLGFYLYLLVLPIKMSCYYGFNVVPLNNVFNIYGITGIVLLLVLVYIFLRMFNTRNLLWYGVMYFSISISMFLNFVKPAPGIVADRFLFMPSVGWSMIMTYLIEWVNQKYLSKKNNKHLFNFSNLDWWKNTKIKVYLLVYFIFCSILIWQRNHEWRYKLYLYEADSKKYPESVKLHILYGSQIIIEYLQGGNVLSKHEMPKYLELAMQEFQKGIQIDSTCGSCYNNVAYLLMNWKHDYEGSISYLKKAYRYDTTRKELLTNIAISYLKTNRSRDTIELLIRKAIKADKDKNYEVPYTVMKELYIKEKQYTKGTEFFNEQLSERPYSQYLYHTLGELYILNKDTANAIRIYQKLLEINPNHAEISEYLHNLKEKYNKKHLNQDSTHQSN